MVEDEGDEGRVRAAAEVGGGEVLRGTRGGWRRRGGRGGSASGERGEDLSGEGEKERKNGGGGVGGKYP